VWGKERSKVEGRSFAISWHDIKGMLRSGSIGMAYICLPCQEYCIARLVWLYIIDLRNTILSYLSAIVMSTSAIGLDSYRWLLG